MPIDGYFNKIAKSKLLKHHPEAEIEEYKSDPAIIHYLSTKPWNVNSLEAVEGFELDKFQLWWDNFYECLEFVNKKAIFQLYAKLNKNILTLGDEYCKEQTIPNTIKRLISLTSKKLGIHSILKSLEKKVSQ
jgi:lipopolysaccharide biosynthesis glycosyltransferase